MPWTVAVRVTWPIARAVSTGELSVEILAREVLSMIQVTSVRGRPCSSTAVNICVWPTTRLTLDGVICNEFGDGKGTLSLTCIFVRAMFPAKSTARTTTKLTPGFNERLQEKFPPDGATGTPLHVSEATPDKASDTVPVTAIPAVVKTAPSAGEPTARVGGVFSIFNVTLAVAVAPAASVTVPLTT